MVLVPGRSKLCPLTTNTALSNRDWVEGNLKKVNEATDGQVAYVYVPNTAGPGHEYFKRYFFPQANRQAIIVDERFNGADPSRLLHRYSATALPGALEHALWQRFKTPSASIQGPKVMIIDETAGSGGDMLPWMFRKFEWVRWLENDLGRSGRNSGIS